MSTLRKLITWGVILSMGVMLGTLTTFDILSTLHNFGLVQTQVQNIDTGENYLVKKYIK